MPPNCVDYECTTLPLPQRHLLIHTQAGLSSVAGDENTLSETFRYNQGRYGDRWYFSIFSLLEISCPAVYVQDGYVASFFFFHGRDTMQDVRIDMIQRIYFPPPLKTNRLASPLKPEIKFLLAVARSVW